MDYERRWHRRLEVRRRKVDGAPKRLQLELYDPLSLKYLCFWTSPSIYIRARSSRVMVAFHEFETNPERDRSIRVNRGHIRQEA